MQPVLNFLYQHLPILHIDHFERYVLYLTTDLTRTNCMFMHIVLVSQVVEKPELIGIDFLWGICLNTPNNDIAEMAVDLLMSMSYSYLSPRLKKVRHPTLSSYTPPCLHIPHPVFIYPTLSSYTPPYLHIPHPVFIYPTLSSYTPPCLHIPHPVYIYPTLSSYTPPYIHIPHPVFIYPTLPSYTPPCLHIPHPVFIYPTLSSYTPPCLHIHWLL